MYRFESNSPIGTVSTSLLMSSLSDQSTAVLLYQSSRGSIMYLLVVSLSMEKYRLKSFLIPARKSDIFIFCGTALLISIGSPSVSSPEDFIRSHDPALTRPAMETSYIYTPLVYIHTLTVSPAGMYTG